MTTTTTKYKKGKKRKAKKKKISADLQDLRYKINYTTYNTTENDLFTQHYMHKFSYNNVAYKSYIAVCFCSVFTIFIVVLPGVTYNVTF